MERTEERRKSFADGRWVYPAMAVLLLASIVLLGRCPMAHPMAQDFTLPVVTAEGRVTGDRMRLGDQHGKVVVLDFWATWCRPCQITTPTLVRVSHRFRNRGVVVMGVNVDQDGPEAIPTFMRRFAVDYPMVFDEGGGVSNRYNVRALPTLMVIDREGRVRHTHQGVATEDELAEQIEGLL